MSTQMPVSDNLDHKADFERFQQREHVNQQMHHEALNALASVLHDRGRPCPRAEGPPLVAALRVVGDAIGVLIRLPATDETPKHAQEQIEAVARASQVRVRRVSLPDRWWTRNAGPLLGHTRDGGEPVALLPVSATRYECFNPNDLSRTLVTPSYAETLEPFAYTVHRPYSYPIRRWWDLVRFGLKGHARDLITVLLTGLCITALGILTPLMTAILIDRAIPSSDRHMVFQIGLVLLAAALGQLLFRLAQSGALLRQSTGALNVIQTATWDYVLKLAPTFFRQYAVGDLKTRMAAVSNIHQKISNTALQTLLSVLMVALNLGVMIYYSPVLALIALATGLLTLLVTTGSGVLTMRYISQLEALRGKTLGLTVQLINGVNKLRVANAEARAFAHWSEHFRHQQQLRMKIQHREDLLTVFNAMLAPLSTIVLFWFVTTTLSQVGDASTFSLSSGIFLAFYTAFGTFVSGVNHISLSAIDMLEVATLWERAKPVVSSKPEIDSSHRDPGALTGKIAIEHVTFRYEKLGKVILDDISLQVEPGEFIALVGPSGSGKSTLMRLLLGFETPEVGTIFYDDQELGDIDVSAVRRQMGTVLQQTHIMAASIRDNIAGGARISLEEAWAAAQAAGLADDIDAMPMKMHTFISEGGTNLSGGQRQRLLIARALAARPNIVLFDEATSALDNRTQAIVARSLEALQTTRVVVAHRLSTIRNADRIYVLEQGKIIQVGSFEVLAQQDGLFAQLIRRQEI